MNIKYPLAKETINNQDINALCDWLKPLAFVPTVPC